MSLAHQTRSSYRHETVYTKIGAGFAYAPGTQIFTWTTTTGSTSYTFNLILPDQSTQSFNCSSTSYSYRFDAEETGTYFWYVTDNSNGTKSQVFTFNGMEEETPALNIIHK